MSLQEGTKLGERGNLNTVKEFWCLKKKKRNFSSIIKITCKTVKSRELDQSVLNQIRAHLFLFAGKVVDG